MVSDAIMAMCLTGEGGVLVLVAHPDDEALLCGGTIAALCAGGCSVQVVCFSDGGQGRDAAFSAACGELGAEGRLLNYASGAMVLNASLVDETDKLIRAHNPRCVITHTRLGVQHQDHVALHDAVRLSVGRSSQQCLVLAAEPPISSNDFAPTVFVDVTPWFRAKCAVVHRYRAILDRPYMADEYLRARARWWGQVAGVPEALVEAYEPVLWR
jgi:LmbE family N-acetylglucosaminyl deacetylase